MEAQAFRPAKPTPIPLTALAVVDRLRAHDRGGRGLAGVVVRVCPQAMLPYVDPHFFTTAVSEKSRGKSLKEEEGAPMDRMGTPLWT